MLGDEARGGADVRRVRHGGAAADGVAEEADEDVGGDGGGDAGDVGGGVVRAEGAREGRLPRHDEAAVPRNGGGLAGGQGGVAEEAVLERAPRAAVTLRPRAVGEPDALLGTLLVDEAKLLRVEVACGA